MDKKRRYAPFVVFNESIPHQFPFSRHKNKRLKADYHPHY
jgi:hypothetical protein